MRYVSGTRNGIQSMSDALWKRMRVSGIFARFNLTSFDNVATRGYILAVKTVGIRELKNRLSEHLREVRRGEHLLITDRGEVIGELSPPGQSIAETSVPVGVLALARRGMLTLGNPGDRSPYPALPRLRRGKHDSASMLDAERGRR
jgi:antitoxin (DNA-binding transcriptional repressor) of toxin-antitoxin stability system